MPKPSPAPFFSNRNDARERLTAEFQSAVSQDWNVEHYDEDGRLRWRIKAVEREETLLHHYFGAELTSDFKHLIFYHGHTSAGPWGKISDLLVPALVIETEYLGMHKPGACLTYLMKKCGPNVYGYS